MNKTFTGITYFPLSEQYMAYDIFNKCDNEVFVDIGAGPKAETLWSFLKYNDSNFAFYYMFDPFCNISRTRLPYNTQNKVFLFNNAVGEKEQKLKFRNYMDTNALIIDGGEEIATCICLDNFLFTKEPTFIKIDTEGYEKEVLKGSLAVINECRPIIACAIYHKLEDFWEIPLMLKRLPNYNFYLRSYMGVYETILYAVPEERTI